MPLRRLQANVAVSHVSHVSRCLMCRFHRYFFTWTLQLPGLPGTGRLPPGTPLRPARHPGPRAPRLQVAGSKGDQVTLGDGKRSVAPVQAHQQHGRVMDLGHYHR